MAQRIQESSGHRALDEEVLSMIEQAQPLPAMPESMERDTLAVVVPVRFSLR
ncbi:energy transducer TonB family protein [Thiohalorhabdus sp.]|uniref:energy transducer TonB family protein n=1 Tax=Thiohalorhabdus sp. TaxID=3094134 RepID=UPI002FC2A950